ncbi:cytochrome P450 [Streptomyces sp. NPDC093149]|uniref:cytochrome P450 n=1 Tax=Streptomyces sp. NPDC093149 TaxID=3366031 RepID=UPI0038306730
MTTPPPECPARTAASPVPLSGITASTSLPDTYHDLRETWGPVARVELEPGVNAWLVMGHPELLHLVRNEHVFSRDARNWGDYQSGVVAPDSGLGPMMFYRDNVIGADGMEHRRLRRPLDDALAAVDQRQMRRIVERTCRDLLAAFRHRGHADLVSEYAQIVPLLALAAVSGLDPQERQELLETLAALFGSADDAQDGNRRFEEILARLIRARQVKGASDMASSLVRHPDLRSDDEILQSLVVLISAGQQTLSAWISRALWLMLTDPRFESRLRGGRLGVGEALDEVLWHDPPMTHMPARYALIDTELGGRRIACGDALILGLAAANADPRIHTDAMEREIDNRSHLGWSAGPHQCPARTPARLIARVAVEQALHGLPRIALSVPAEAVTSFPSPWMRHLETLPVTFAPARDTALDPSVR